MTLILVGITLWAALIWDNRHHIRHDRWEDDE